ncbi:MAG: Nif3-like dinuclear metal center hexameric protein [Pseudomonadales bacterium]|nr:Nif3-like dinuclear metal center hexameric protein [Pseudomonadales bacterium]
MSVSLQELESELNRILQPNSFQDYCPNGLQVEGKPKVSKLISGVTASLALIESAITLNADALLVHHGYFWKGENQTVVGMKKERIKLLLDNDISLFAYHLPLDAHASLGNNAQLGKLMGAKTKAATGRPGEPELVLIGELPEVKTPREFSRILGEQLQREPVWVEGRTDQIKTLAWCTGAAQNYFELAIAAGVDAFVTGEISEPSAHLARESGVHFFSAGHHATERYGVQAVGEYLTTQLDVQHQFVDIDNPA